MRIAHCAVLMPTSTCFSVIFCVLRFLITAITRFLDVWTGTKGTLRGSCGPKSLFGNLLQEEALASQGSGRGQPGARHTEQSFIFFESPFFQNNADKINVDLAPGIDSTNIGSDSKKSRNTLSVPLLINICVQECQTLNTKCRRITWAARWSAAILSPPLSISVAAPASKRRRTHWP